MKKLEDGEEINLGAEIDDNKPTEDDLDFVVADDNTNRASTPTDPTIEPSVTAPTEPVVTPSTSSSTLTKEQLERIERNRQLALEKRRQKDSQSSQVPMSQASQELDESIQDDIQINDEDATSFDDLDDIAVPNRPKELTEAEMEEMRHNRESQDDY